MSTPDVAAGAVPVGLEDHLLLERAATRRLGDDLLVAPLDPWRPIERLSGSASLLWELFGSGCSAGEVIDRAAHHTGAQPADIRDDVLSFAGSLLARGLAHRR